MRPGHWCVTFLGPRGWDERVIRRGRLRRYLRALVAVGFDYCSVAPIRSNGRAGRSLDAPHELIRRWAGKRVAVEAGERSGGPKHAESRQARSGAL